MLVVNERTSQSHTRPITTTLQYLQTKALLISLDGAHLENSLEHLLEDGVLPWLAFWIVK